MQVLRTIRGAIKSNNRTQLTNSVFFCLDASLTVLSLLGLVFWGPISQCLASFYLFFILLYTTQTIMHYLLLKLPKIDVIAFDVIIKRLIGMVCFVMIVYLLLVIVYWQRAHIHPIYCAVCEEFQWPYMTGILFPFHFVFCAGFVINLIHSFVTRKYYLIALGGFQVQQRLALERQQALRRIGLIQPVFVYPAEASIKSGKYYKFEDVRQSPSEDICSICLNRRLQSQNIIKTKCNHLYHRQCIEKWATVNSKCPDCRTQFQQDFTQRKLQVIEENANDHQDEN